MKRLNRILKEVNFLANYGKTNRLDTDEQRGLASTSGYKIIGTDGNFEYRMYKIKNSFWKPTYEQNFIAVDKKTNLVVMRVYGDGMDPKRKGDPVIYHIGTLAGAEGSPLKADVFYKNVMKFGNVILTTDSQSPGGMNVWKRLGAHKDVSVNGWDPDKKVGLNLNPADEEDIPDIYQTDKIRDDTEYYKRVTGVDNEFRLQGLKAAKQAKDKEYRLDKEIADTYGMHQKGEIRDPTKENQIRNLSLVASLKSYGKKNPNKKW